MSVKLSILLALAALLCMCHQSDGAAAGVSNKQRQRLCALDSKNCGEKKVRPAPLKDEVQPVDEDDSAHDLANADDDAADDEVQHDGGVNKLAADEYDARARRRSQKRVKKSRRGGNRFYKRINNGKNNKKANKGRKVRLNKKGRKGNRRNKRLNRVRKIKSG